MEFLYICECGSTCTIEFSPSEIRAMGKAPEAVHCGDCGKQAKRDYPNERKGFVIPADFKAV